MFPQSTSSNPLQEYSFSLPIRSVQPLIVLYLYVCVSLRKGMCVHAVIGCVQTHVPKSSSLQATKSMNQKPPKFSQIHNNADHKY